MIFQVHVPSYVAGILTSFMFLAIFKSTNSPADSAAQIVREVHYEVAPSNIAAAGGAVPCAPVPCVPQPTADAALDQLVTCIINSVSFNQAVLCYSVFKRVHALQAVSILKNKAPMLRSEAAHGALFPTHECEYLRLQRLGVNAYATSTTGEHPDGGKWLCAEYLNPSHGEQCVVVSLGSNGDYAFEIAMHQFAPHCRLLTFDCTGYWNVPHSEFHQWCLGGKDEMINGMQYKTLDTMMRELNVQKIHLLKMDIEGYEFSVMKSLEDGPRSALPKQLLVELHFGHGWPGQNPTAPEPPTAQSFFQSIDKMGYQIALRERNMYNGCCAEYVLILDP